MSTNLYDIEWAETTVPCDRHGKQVVKRLVMLGGKAFKHPDTPCCPICTQELDRAKQEAELERNEADRIARYVGAARLLEAPSLT